MVNIRRVLAVAALAAGIAAPGAAGAHPHVWVEVRSEFVFTPDGAIAGVKHAWTFDDMYSAFAVQGLGKDGVPVDKALKELAKVNVTQLAEFGYFTALRVAGREVKFGSVKDPNITMDAKRIITLHFTAMLDKPLRPKPAAVLKVFDPTYFVAFDFAKTRPVTLPSAPRGCSLNMMTPRPLSVSDAQRLIDVRNTDNSPGADFGIKLATSAIVACP